MSSAILTQCINRISAIATRLQKLQGETLALELQQCVEDLVEVQQQQQAQARSHDDLEQAFHNSQLCRRLAHFITIGRIYGQSLDQIIASSLQQIHRVFPNWRIAYSTINTQGQLTVIQSLEPEDMPALAGFQVDLNIATEYLATLRWGAPILIEDVAHAPIVAPLAEMMATGGTQAVLGLPLKPCRNLVGLLCWDSPYPHEWSEHEIGTMIEIADYLSYALQESHAEQERRNSEAALHEANRELQQYAEQLEAAHQEVEMSLEELRCGNEELISAHQEIEQQRQRYQDLFNFAPDGYLVTDAWGNIQQANQAARILLAVWDDRQILGKPLSRFIPLKERRGFQTQLNQFIKLRQLRQFEVDLHSRQGTSFSVEITVRAIEEKQGEQVKLLWLIRDISDKKRAELALQQLNEELEERVQQRTADLTQTNTQLQSEIAERLQVSAERSRLIAILDASADCIGMATSQGNILWNNPQLKKVRGLNPDTDVTLLKLADYHPQWAAQMIQQQGIPTAIRDGVWVGETAIFDHNEQEIPVSQMIVAHKSAEGRVDYLSTVMRDISDRKNAEKHIRFQARLLDTVEQAVIATDLQGRITYWNRFAQVLYGWSSDEVLGRFILEVTPASTTQAEAAEIFSRLQAGESWSGEFLVQRRDGTMFPIMIVDSPIYDDQGILSGMVGISLDITQLKQAEIALREREELFRQLAENIRDIFLVYSADLQLIYVSPAYEEIWGESREYFYTHPDDWIERVHPEDQDRIIRILPHIKQKNLTYEYRFVRRDGQERWIRMRTFLVKDESENLHRIVGIGEDFTERKAAELALTAVSHRLQYLLTSSPAVIFSCSPDGDYDVTFISQNISNILGYEAEEFLTSSQFWMMRVHPDDLEKVLVSFRNILEQGVCSYEYRFLHADGTYHWLNTKLRLMQDDVGKPKELVGYLIDISDKKLAEDKLRETQQNLQAILDYSPAAIYLIDRDNKHLLVNHRYETLVTATQENLIGKSIYEVWPTEFCDAFALNNRQILQSGKSMEFEEVAPHADGVHTYITIKFPLYDAKGIAYAVCGISADITERKQVEAAHRRSEARFRALMQTSPDIITLSTPEGGVSYQSPAVERILGYAPEEFVGGLPQQALHPDDRENLQVTLAKVLANPGIPFSIEYRLQHKKGSWVWLEGISTNLLNEPDIQAFVVFSRDICDRKQSEEKLQASQRLIQKIADSSPNILYLYDLEEQRNVYVNREITQMLGYTPEEIHAMGQELLSGLMHPDDWSLTPEKMKQIDVASDGEVIEFEYRMRHKNGEWRWLYSWDTVFLRTPEGKPKQILGSATDVSDRKQAEAKIQASLEEKEVLLREIHHRVKNNLQVIHSLLRLQSSYTDDPKTLQMFQESQNRIRSMALIHELLYQSQDLSRIDFGSYIQTLVQQIARTYTVTTDIITWKIQVEPNNIQISIDTALPCGLLINELVSNALKYAFPSEQPGQIQISLQACNHEEFTLVISDNGVGIPLDLNFRQTDSLGLQLVCGMTGQIGGTIELDRTQGTKFTIKFKEIKYKPRS